MLNDLLNLVFPKLCFVCSEGLHSNEENLCFACKKNLPLSAFPPSYNNPTANVFRSRNNLEWGYSVMEFTAGGISQQILHALKYRNARNITEQILNPDIFENTFKAYEKAESIIPVPLHPKKLARRGFNQAGAIAKTLGQLLDIRVKEDAMIRTVFNKTQTRKNKYDRHADSQSLFKAVSNIPEHVLIVDDVLTTGATLHSMIDALPKYTKFSIFTLARA